MEIELIYDSLFSLINGIISAVNVILLGITISKYRNNSTINENIEVSQDSNVKASESCAIGAAVPVEENVNNETDIKRIDILMSKATEDRLLEDFKKAKETQFYLQKGVSMKNLADLLCTNQRYVSYILNKHIGMDFKNFVQQARVDYLIESIEQDPNLLNEKFAVLADRVGFSSMSKFSSVFKAIKGMPPSEYFQRLRAAG